MRVYVNKEVVNISENKIASNDVKTKECSHCKTQINFGATKCPHCQTDLRGFFAKHPVISGCIILFFFVFIVIPISVKRGSDDSKTSGEKPNADTTTTVTKEPESTPTQVQPEPKSEDYLKVITANFIDEFDKNQLAAEEKYKGKLIEFTAYISNISEDIFGKPFLSLKPSSDKYYFKTSVQCAFKDKAPLVELENEQLITVRGRVGTQTLGIIGVSECSVVK